MLYQQNGDRIVAIDFVTSLHPVYLLKTTEIQRNDFTVSSFPMYVVLYFKLSVLHIAYFLGPFLFVSFFVCRGMTRGAAVCPASY